ncbi:MAG: peptidase S15, partial [Williamsia herbipolensis]|nr:peptidase S15 [Williamsia herbipolensis]
EHGPVVVRSPQHTGVDAGRFFPFGNATDLPPDQRAEDGRSVCFDLPIDEAVDVLGNVVVGLGVRSDVPRATVTVRLCDVAPDGSSTLVTRGVLNAARRDGMDRADPLEPGEDAELRVSLVATGHRFAAGHLLRIAVSTAYWPWVWPHGVAATVTIDPARSTLTLPVWTGPADDGVRFAEPERSTPLAIDPVASTSTLPQRSVVHDVESGEWTLDVDPGYGGGRRYPDGLVFREDARETYRIREDDPTSARATSRWAIALEQESWRARIETESEVSATVDAFHVVNTVRAWARDGAPEAPEVLVTERTFVDDVPRTSA